MLVLALQFSRATSDLWMDPGSTRGHLRHRSAVPATSSSARPSEAAHHTNSVMRVAPSKRNRRTARIDCGRPKPATTLSPNSQ